MPPVRSAICPDCETLFYIDFFQRQGSSCDLCSCKRQMDEKIAEITNLQSQHKMEKDAVLKELRSKLEREKNDEQQKLRTELETAQSILTFLCFQNPLDGQPVDGILKGDVKIVVQGTIAEAFFAHKFVLMLEEETGTVCIDDTCLDVVKAVVKFCYDAEIHFTNVVTAEEVLKVAHKYDIALLRELSEENLITKITCENMLNRLKIARKFDLIGLEAEAFQFFKDNFDNAFGNVLAEIL